MNKLRGMNMNKTATSVEATPPSPCWLRRLGLGGVAGVMLAVSLGLAPLAGCGQKGPLTLPKPADGASAPSR